MTESIAKKLVSALKDEKSLEDYEAIILTGYEEAWLEEENNYISIIARTENAVTNIGYTGDEPSEMNEFHNYQSRLSHHHMQLGTNQLNYIW